jgi:hypothetical protein
MRSPFSLLLLPGIANSRLLSDLPARVSASTPFQATGDSRLIHGYAGTSVVITGNDLITVRVQIHVHELHRIDVAIQDRFALVCVYHSGNEAARVEVEHVDMGNGTHDDDAIKMPFLRSCAPLPR